MSRQVNITTFTVSALGQMTDLISPTVWAREANPFRGRKRLPAGDYSCRRFNLITQSTEMIRAVEDGRELAYYILNATEGFVALRRAS